MAGVATLVNGGFCTPKYTVESATINCHSSTLTTVVRPYSVKRRARRLMKLRVWDELQTHPRGVAKWTKARTVTPCVLSLSMHVAFYASQVRILPPQPRRSKSMVDGLLWEQVAAGSNPVSGTNK